MTGMEHLQLARTELLEGTGDERARLVIAARELLAALSDLPTWRSRTGIQSGALLPKLLFGGRVSQAVARMDEVAVRATSNELWQICEYAEPVTRG